MIVSHANADMKEVLRQLRNPNLRVEDGRQHKRIKCFLLATLRTHTHACECIVEDISVGGCRVASVKGSLAVGETVMIDIPEQKMSLSGMTMWVRGKSAGLCFKLVRH